MHDYKKTFYKQQIILINNILYLTVIMKRCDYLSETKEIQPHTKTPHPQKATEKHDGPAPPEAIQHPSTAEVQQSSSSSSEGMYYFVVKYNWVLIVFFFCIAVDPPRTPLVMRTRSHSKADTPNYAVNPEQKENDKRLKKNKK